MRILAIVHGFPPGAMGGTELYTRSHALALGRQGDEVVVLAREADVGRADYEIRRETRDGLRIMWINNTYRRTRSFEETYRNEEIDAAAARVIDEVAPDAAHVHHLTGLSTTIVRLLAERGIPCIATLHDYWLLCHRGQLLDVRYRVCDGPGAAGCHACLGAAAGMGVVGFAGAAVVRAIERRVPAAPGRQARRLAESAAALMSSAGGAQDQERRRLDHMRGVCAQVTHFLAPSRYIRDRFVEFGVAPDRITVSPNGVSPAWDSPSGGAPIELAPDSAYAGNSPRPLRLGFLGSLMISKAPHLLLEAAALLPPGAVSVDLFGGHAAYHGDDGYRRQLEPLLACDGVRTHGAIAHAGVPAALAAIDVLVVPSIWPENAPLVIQEAFRAGIPVVASRIGGIPEMVTDGVNGLLFAAGDAADLSRALARLLAEPGLLATLRAGIPPVRSIDEDVRVARSMYEHSVSIARGPAFDPPTVERDFGPAGVAQDFGPAGVAQDSSPARVAQDFSPAGVAQDFSPAGVAQDFSPAGVAQDSSPARVAQDFSPAGPCGSGGSEDPRHGSASRLAAIVLNFRTPDETLLAVKALLASRRPLDAVIVVNNDAADGTRAALKDVLSKIVYIDTGSNRGFSGGMNVGIREALALGADRVLLVNSDVIVPPDAIARLERALDAAPGIGIAGPVVLARAEPDRIATLGMSYTPLTGRMTHRGTGDRVADHAAPAACGVVDAVSGCLMLVRREVFDAVGLLDEAYFFTFEDLDFCLEARRKGFATVVAGEAIVYHEGGRSLGPTSPRRFYYAARNHLRLARRTDPSASACRSLGRACSIVLLNLAHAIVSPGGSLPVRLAAVARGTRDYIAGRFGAGRT